MKNKSTKIQEEYYQQTANDYDISHLLSTDFEHQLALAFLSSLIDLFEIRSILDVGAGTGRTIEYMIKRHPNVKIIGIEPVKELREQGYLKGIPESVLINGDGNEIKYEDCEFDLVCEFAVLHHVSNPRKIVSEMLRVAKKGIFISDANNFGQGTLINRSFKQVINFFRLWKIYNFLRTSGKGYHISEGDGLFYSYSVFNDYQLIKRFCKKIHFLNTGHGGVNPYTSAPHVAIFGLK